MRRLFLCCCLLLFAASCRAQPAPTTIVLLRHAEKDTTGRPADPPLTAAGKQRAQRLPVALKALHPDAFYSTATTRTRESVRPWAEQRGKAILPYDARHQAALADSLKTVPGKTFVVVGHSNTIPAFVNRLTGTTAYPDLPDSVYGRLYIVIIRDGKATVREEAY